MTEHAHLLGICLSHRLCPKCRRGYLSRKKAVAAHCPNPACGPSGRFVEFFAPLPMGRVTYGGELARPLMARRARYERLAFRLGRVVLSHMPAEGTLWTWLSERDVARVRPR